MANSSTQGNVTQSSGHTHTATNTALKYRSTNSSQPLAHADVDDNFEILRQAINGIVSDIDTVVQTDVPTGAVFTDTTYVAVTDTVSGLMTGAMKQKLDGIAAGAEVNVQADWNATTGDAQILNKPNIAYTSAIPVATQSADGLMSLADKTKLDGIQAGATAGGGTGGGASVTTDPTAPSNPSDGDLWFNEDTAELYVYTDSLNAWIQTNGGGGSGGDLVESPELEFTTTGEYNASSNPLSVRNGPYPRWEHNLGQTPVFYSMSLRCKVAEEGWDVGDEFFVGYNGTYGRGEYAVWADSTYVGFVFKSGTTNNPFTVGKKEQSGNNPANITGNSFLPDPTKWKIVFRAATGFGGGGDAEGGTSISIEQGYLYSPNSYTKEPTRNANTPGLEFFCEGFGQDADSSGGPFSHANHLKVRLPTERDEWLLTAVEAYNDYALSTTFLESIYHEEYIQSIGADLWLGTPQSVVTGYTYTHNYGGYLFPRGTHAKLFHQNNGHYGCKLTAKWKSRVNIVEESVFSGGSKLADANSLGGYNSNTSSPTVLDLSSYVGSQRALVKLIVLPNRRYDYFNRDIDGLPQTSEPLHAVYFREHGDPIAPWMANRQLWQCWNVCKLCRITTKRQWWIRACARW